ncbi:ABC transporter permease subunit [Candidatus Peregrinibacteria bacterium]|nr:ABC transporter permease subunit [Candidatus Peregrinibacteria bacterium]
MKIDNVLRIAKKEFHEHKKRVFWTFVSMLMISALFLLPAIFDPWESDTQLFEKYINKNQLMKTADRSNVFVMFLIDIKLPLYIFLATFLSPLFGIMESIINEKENRTLEALFVLPTTDQEIIFGKMLVSLSSGIMLPWLLYIFYMLLFSFMCNTTIALFFLQFKWLFIMIILVPNSAFFINLVGISIASNTKTLQSCYLYAFIILSPLFVILILVSIGTIFISIKILLVITILLIPLTVLSFFIAIWSFRREKILLRY